MRRVLLFLGMGSTAASRTNPNSAATIECPDCSETDAPNNQFAVVVAGPYPDHEAEVHISTGTKEEAFFDSEPWVESDCEDFFSVQGEKTPSLNASPAHQKKSLRELLCESFDRKEHIDPLILIEEKAEEELPNNTFKLQRRKSSGSARHCFPGLVRSLSCSEWKKKRLSPVHTAQC